MADRFRRHRQPLADLNTANTPPRRQHLQDKNRDGRNSLELLPVGAGARGQQASPQHRQLSKLANEEDDASKRNSAISTASTTASGQKRKTYIGHWQLGKTIGQGGCSRVRAVRHRHRDLVAAVKIVARSTAESTRAQSLANLIESTMGSHTAPSVPGYKPIPFGLEREIALMKLLEHNNIVKLYDVWENRNELYLIMEYVDGGELFHYVEQRRGLSEKETVIIFRQIISALLYCHRLHICHRDLKPENILLNQKNLEVKLIDFGMAALQPVGGLLSTPCGSPHYAAPEVVSSRPYDGKCADTWSCGVILYVMLTGTTPYNYSQDGDIRALFANITRAQYVMPPGLSSEAKDLIRRIFVPNPKYRISLDAIWDHPLLHKYDKELGYMGEKGSKENAIGPVPKLEDWTVKHASEVDRDILRNMRTLWHSEPESSLVKKLLNNEVNQEKIFYAALIKHRDDNLEDFKSEYDSVGYSASDYHHNNRTFMPVPLDKQARSQSQYSIMNDEHLRPSHSFVEPTPSLSSYDPYRSSRDPIVRGSEFASVVVRRNSSLNTQRASVQTSVRQNKSLRVGMLKHNNRGLYNSSSSLARSRSSLPRSSMSKNSLSTTAWPSSPPVIATMRPSELHKKGVSFNHLRRTSTTPSVLTAASIHSTPVTPKTRRKTSTFEVPESSPEEASQQVIRSKKAHIVHTARIRTRKNSETPSQTFRSDIRKHSMELEKACEEAFFRSSVPSTQTNSPHTDVSTPPSSTSTRTPELSKAPRPLPDVPTDTPTTFLARTLKEFRAKLASYNPPDNGEDVNFGEVMQLIDTMLPAQHRAAARRYISAPEARIPDHLGSALPIISEEGGNDVPVGRFRSFTAPVSKSDEHTIRVVPPSPASAAPADQRKPKEHEDKTSKLKVQSKDLRRQHSYDAADMLEAIDENEPLQANAPVVRKKKSLGWLGLAKKFTSSSQPDPQVETKRITVVEAETEELPNDHSLASSEFPVRQKQIPGRRSLGKWLTKRNAVVKNGDDTRRPEPDWASTDTSAADSAIFNRSVESFFSTSSPSPSTNVPVDNNAGRSWFARFLNIKPATKLVCFCIPRNRARQELIILLKAWQSHGIRDLVYSRETSSITARVDRHNTLNIKPVTFRIELFVVLEHGRRVSLSIARFTQLRGAASAFKKVLEVVEGVAHDNNWLVRDEDKWKAMTEIIDG